MEQPFHADNAVRRTPLLLMILVHYYGCVDDFPRASAPACLSLIQELTRIGMLKTVTLPGARERQWEITARGRAWIAALLRVPFPISHEVWEVRVSDSEGDYEVIL